MFNKQKQDWGTRGVKIFYSLLILCAFEVLLWSFAAQSSAGFTDAAQAYYTRETGNLKSTTGQTVRAPSPSIDFHSLELALKAESAWHQRALASLYAVAPTRPLQLPSQQWSAQSQSLSERLHDSEGESTGKGIVISAH